MKKIEVMCSGCGELVEIEDKGFCWALCEECDHEYEADLIKEYEANKRED